MRGMIAAVSPEGVIGLDGKIPRRHPGDLRRFKRLTTGGVVVMGRLTWESMARRALPGRRNVVVTRRAPVPAVADIETYADVPSALAALEGDTRDVWFIGGARIYAAAMDHADVIDLTYVPEHVEDPAAVRFPEIDPARWEAGPLVPHEDEAGLTRRVYTRRR
jgi:dihydrofolate reductase